ncbi:hypothetical protein C6W24_04385 [Bacillus atrophaeus]|nr:hypothetical protein C6W24_04385 [Bacillus atrophaeus]
MPITTHITLKEGLTLKDVAVKLNLLTEKQIEEMFKPEDMVRPNI